MPTKYIIKCLDTNRYFNYGSTTLTFNFLEDPFSAYRWTECRKADLFNTYNKIIAAQKRNIKIIKIEINEQEDPIIDEELVEYTDLTTRLKKYT